MFDDETPVAWQAVPRHAPVVASDGSEIGTAESILGDEAEDIFHGVAVKLSDDGKTVEIAAARIKKMTKLHIVTDLTPDDAKVLPLYRAS